MPKSKTYQIKIESILGGHSVSSHFGSSDSFQGSGGIDPSQDVAISGTDLGITGMLAPNGLASGGGALNAPPLWMVTPPKVAATYVLDASGSTYTLNSAANQTGLEDGGNESGTGSGNGAAYYDNYVYFAKNTTIARYGPLDGSPSMNGDYWGTTLGKAALTHTTYPVFSSGGISITVPNHLLHRHSDGRLYIADVVGNQGNLHFISTTKTTVEGDTDNGSTFGKLDFGYGLWPTAIESYGSDIVVALYEGDTVSSGRQQTAKLAFWDTTSENFNQITWVEFPDQIITALRNVNGTLYVVSSQVESSGFRLSRFVGGYSFEEVAFFPDGYPPMAGAVLNVGHRLFFGSSNSRGGGSGPCVYSFGLATKSLGSGVFCTARVDTGFIVSALSNYWQSTGADLSSHPNIGVATSASSGTVKVVLPPPTGLIANPSRPWWWSQMYKIGQPYKITKLRIGTLKAFASGMSVVPKFYIDGDHTNTLTLPDVANYIGQSAITYRPSGLVGQNNFFLELEWGGTAQCVIALPITIEYEIIDD